MPTPTIEQQKKEFEKEYGSLELDPETRGVVDDIKSFLVSSMLLAHNEALRMVKEKCEELKKKPKSYHDGPDEVFYMVEREQGHNQALSSLSSFLDGELKNKK